MNNRSREHVDRLCSALESSMDQLEVALRWGSHLARILPRGNRILVAGNGGSAAQAQHLTAELVGRYQQDRLPFSALALHAETSSLTAIVNDYGPNEMFARQVEAHARPGDICLLMSTSGCSPNLLTAARRARAFDIEVWAMTGPTPNALASMSNEVLAVDSDNCAAIQEAHLVALHMLCEQLDADLMHGGAVLEKAVGR